MENSAHREAGIALHSTLEADDVEVTSSSAGAQRSATGYASLTGSLEAVRRQLTLVVI